MSLVGLQLGGNECNPPPGKIQNCAASSDQLPAHNALHIVAQIQARAADEEAIQLVKLAVIDS